MLKKSNKSRRGVVEPVAPNPVRITGVVVAGSNATITFDQPVRLHGLPGWSVDILGADPVDAQLTSPTVLVLTFSNAITGAAQLSIPYQDPAVRSTSGGFVADTLYLLA